jgi:hypothetical protein
MYLQPDLAIMSLSLAVGYLTWAALHAWVRNTNTNSGADQRRRPGAE